MTTIRNMFAGAASIALIACSSATAHPTRDAGNTVTRDFAISKFHGVSVAGAYDVTVTEGGSAQLSATGGANILENTKISVEDGILKIEMKKNARKIHWKNKKPVKITVSGGDMIDSASIAGSGELSVATASGDDFKGSVAGSGDLDVGGIKADEVKLSIAGSGEIEASGTARTANYSIAGSGDMDASALRVGDAKISIAGSGDVRGYATGDARVNIAGSGDVALDGGADCSVRKAGSGNVRCN